MNKVVEVALDEVKTLALAEKYEEAIRRVDELVINYPNNPLIWRKRAYVNSLLGHIEAAIADVSRAISMCDIEPDFFFTRGTLFFGKKSYKDAVSDFTKVIWLCDYHKSDYYRGMAYFYRADAYFRLKEFENAKADCQHLEDGMRGWTDMVRTKEDILTDCQREV